MNHENRPTNLPKMISLLLGAQSTELGETLTKIQILEIIAAEKGELHRKYFRRVQKKLAAHV